MTSETTSPGIGAAQAGTATANRTVGDIEIWNAEVSATGGTSGAGIGSGFVQSGGHSSVSSISILNSTIKALPVGYAAGITYFMKDSEISLPI
jgi:hypothetical protein